MQEKNKINKEKNKTINSEPLKTFKLTILIYLRFNIKMGQLLLLDWSNGDEYSQVGLFPF